MNCLSEVGMNMQVTGKTVLKEKLIWIPYHRECLQPSELQNSWR